LSGPADWTSFQFRHLGLWIDGTQIEGGAAYPLADLSVLNRSAMLGTVSGTEILQKFWLGQKAPVNVRSTALPVQFNLKNEADYRLIVSRAARGVAVEIYPDWPLMEEWYIPAKDSGQTEWEPARKFPWDISGVTHSTRAPRVYIDDVEQTVITGGTPTSGQAKVPEAGGFGVVTMPSGITGTWLRLEYHPVFTVLITEVGQKYQQHNNLVFAIQMVEQMARRFNT